MAQTKKQTPPTLTLRVLPPPPADPPLEDNDALIGPRISFEECDTAFYWLESLADLMSVALTSNDDLGDNTIHHVACIMEQIAIGGHASLRREQEKARREGR